MSGAISILWGGGVVLPPRPKAHALSRDARAMLGALAASAEPMSIRPIARVAELGDKAAKKALGELEAAKLVVYVPRKSRAQGYAATELGRKEVAKWPAR